MGSRQSYYRTVDGQEMPLHSRPFCLPSLSKASHLLQLEIGSRGDSSECPVPTLGDVNRLCFPAFLLDRQVPGQDYLRESPSDNPHNSPLEITSVVPSHLANVGGIPLLLPSPKKILTDPLGKVIPWCYRVIFSQSLGLCQEFTPRSRTFRECYRAHLCFMEK